VLSFLVLLCGAAMTLVLCCVCCRSPWFTLFGQLLSALEEVASTKGLSAARDAVHQLLLLPLPDINRPLLSRDSAASSELLQVLYRRLELQLRPDPSETPLFDVRPFSRPFSFRECAL
jgi:hypothetical protein